MEEWLDVLSVVIDGRQNKKDIFVVQGVKDILGGLMERNNYREATGSIFLLLVVCLIICFSGFAFSNSIDINETSQKITSKNTTIILDNPPVKDIGTLEKILTPMVENTIIENGDCLSYTLHYKKYLSNTNLILDIRKIDLAGICPIGTKECGEDAGTKHTYLIINGYGGECILDQHKLACIQVKDEM